MAKKKNNKLTAGDFVRDLVLGSQDGLVNILGIVLGVAIATDSTRIVLISGLAATFAESISMAAVAYTSSKAAKEYYAKDGVGKMICRLPSGKAVKPEFLQAFQYPLQDSILVGLASLIGSFVPLLPYFFFSVYTSTILAVIITTAVLFAVGAYKAKFTRVSWTKSGLEMAIIGTLSALTGFIIGKLLQGIK